MYPCTEPFSLLADAQDFEESLREVGASVSPDSSAVQELSSWNDRFGTAGGKGARAFDKRLSYFT